MPQVRLGVACHQPNQRDENRMWKTGKTYGYKLLDVGTSKNKRNNDFKDINKAGR